MPKQNPTTNLVTLGGKRVPVPGKFAKALRTQSQVDCGGGAQRYFAGTVEFPTFGHTILDRFGAKDEMANGTVSLDQLESHL